MKKDLINNKILSLGWMADAPCFIDKPQISNFYDAIVRPDFDQEFYEFQLSESNVKQIRKKLNLSSSVTTTEIGSLLSGIFTFIKPSISAEKGKEVGEGTTAKSGYNVRLQPVNNPYRQLINLSLHYLSSYPERLFIVENGTDEKQWRDPNSIISVPRSLVFLNLPSQSESKTNDVPETKLIPTACEFENGKIELLYDKLLSSDHRCKPPTYESGNMTASVRKKRKEYWQWFNDHFNEDDAIRVVENSASENGRISWIDYRVPLTNSGDTLHLHVCPNGDYDTGVFAYNFIKRGYKHGIRIIGTMKSEPDMNVLAIYEK